MRRVAPHFERSYVIERFERGPTRVTEALSFKVYVVTVESFLSTYVRFLNRFFDSAMVNTSPTRLAPSLSPRMTKAEVTLVILFRRSTLPLRKTTRE